MMKIKIRLECLVCGKRKMHVGRVVGTGYKIKSDLTTCPVCSGVMVLVEIKTSANKIYDQGIRIIPDVERQIEEGKDD